MTPTDSPLDLRAARVALEDLRRLERELVELDAHRRIDALDRVREAVHRIGEVGSPEGVLDRAAEELGASSRFGRVLISQVRERLLVPHSLWTRDGDGRGALVDELRGAPIPLEYPLVEAEVAGNRGAETVVVETSGARSPARLRELMGWDHYVVVALTLRGNAIGLLHADDPSAARPPDELDREVASLYADGLAGAFERAALRATLARHRDELRGGVRWLTAHLDEAAELVVEPGAAGDWSADPLTPREQQVLQLLSGGHTNASIAKVLLVSESTVKYHVKNLLRKLQATSRADAVSRYLRGAR